MGISLLKWLILQLKRHRIYMYSKCIGKTLNMQRHYLRNDGDLGNYIFKSLSVRSMRFSLP